MRATVYVYTGKEEREKKQNNNDDSFEMRNNSFHFLTRAAVNSAPFAIQRVKTAKNKC